MELPYTAPAQKNLIGLLLSGTTRNTSSARYVVQIRLQLREIEALREPGHLRFRGQDGVRLVHAFVPPGPRALLGISPGQHSYTVRIIRHRVNRVSIIRQGTRRPRFVIVEILNAVLLDLETHIHAAEDLNGLLHVRVIFRIDLHIGEDLVGGDGVRSPVIQHVQLVQAGVRPARQVVIQLFVPQLAS